MKEKFPCFTVFEGEDFFFDTCEVGEDFFFGAVGGEFFLACDEVFCAMISNASEGHVSADNNSSACEVLMCLPEFLF